MQTSRLNDLAPMLAVLASVTALGVGTSYAKQLFPVVGAQGTTLLRVGFSALVLLAIWRPWRWPLQRGDATSILRYGVALGVMNLLFYMSIRTIPFGVAVAIEFTGPLSVALLSSRRAIDFFWVALATSGLALLLPLSKGSTSLDLMGVLYALGAAVSWALYIVFGKRTAHLHAGHSVSLGLVAATLVVLPFGIMHAGAALLDPQVLLFGAAIAIISSAIPMSLEMMALKRLPRETFGILLSMEPAVVALLALMLLSEHLSTLQWLAIGCTVLASVGSTMTARKDPSLATAPST